MANVSHAETRRAGLDREVEKSLAGGPTGMVLTVWAGFADGRELYAREADRAMPVASAIKAAILVELYAEYDRKLDHPPGAAAILSEDDTHPALAHYRTSDRAAVRSALCDATVDEIGRVMIGKSKAPNCVYNGAANVAIALLGGPKAASEAFKIRDPAWAGLVLNRYMLANRGEHGDNTSTAAALASVHRRLASRDVPGLSPATVDRVRAVLAKEETSTPRYGKGGSLNSAPLTRVHAGWREGDRRSLVWVVMGAAPKPSPTDPGTDDAYGSLKEGVRSVWDAVDKTYRPTL